MSNRSFLVPVSAPGLTLTTTPLGVASGGTGASTLTGFLLGAGTSAITAVSNPLPIANGGTGSTSASAACSALGAAHLVGASFTGTVSIAQSVNNVSFNPAITYAGATDSYAIYATASGAATQNIAIFGNAVSGTNNIGICGSIGTYTGPTAVSTAGHFYNALSTTTGYIFVAATSAGNVATINGYGLGLGTDCTSGNVLQTTGQITVGNIVCGTVTTGTWNGTPVAAAYVGNLPASQITSGTLALARGGTNADNSSVSPNFVFAGPSSGGSGAASLRALVAADIPSLSSTYLSLSAGGTVAGATTLSAQATLTNGMITTNTPPAEYGDGSDGNVTLSSNTTLSRDMYYNNLTVANGVTVTQYDSSIGVWKIFVKGTLTVGTSVVFQAKGANAGTAPAAAVYNSSIGTYMVLPGGTSGGVGGVTAAGTAAGPNSGATNQSTGWILAGSGGAGGAGGGNAGGAGGASRGAVQQVFPRQICFPSIFAGSPLGGSFPNFAGSGGGGGGAPSGGSGGGGGGGAHTCFIAAYQISGSFTMQAMGGNGASGTGTNAGGGGGGGGGICWLLTATPSPSVTQTVTGGTGGTATGTGTAGSAGSSGIAVILYRT